MNRYTYPPVVLTIYSWLRLLRFPAAFLAIACVAAVLSHPLAIALVGICMVAVSLCIPWMAPDIPTGMKDDTPEQRVTKKTVQFLIPLATYGLYLFVISVVYRYGNNPYGAPEEMMNTVFKYNLLVFGFTITNTIIHLAVMLEKQFKLMKRELQ